MNIKTNTARKQDDSTIQTQRHWLNQEASSLLVQKTNHEHNVVDAIEWHQESNVTALCPRLDIAYLFESRYRQLKSFLMKRMCNEHDAEEICQSAYLEALCKADSYKGLSRPDVWLFGIALNLLRNHNKKERNRGRMWEDHFIHEQPEAAEIPNDPCHLLDCKKRLRRVSNRLESMPNDMLQIFEAVILENLSYQEVAEKYGIPTGTVRSRLSRIRDKLKEDAVD